jgi:hypothetical protein
VQYRGSIALWVLFNAFSEKAAGGAMIKIRPSIEAKVASAQPFHKVSVFAA